MRCCWLVIAIALGAGCKTAVEKRCDAMFDRYATCSGGEIPGAMRSTAMMYCTITLGRKPAATDPRDMEVMSYRALDECSAITECGALKACFEKHRCQWILTSPDDDKGTFSCWN